MIIDDWPDPVKISDDSVDQMNNYKSETKFAWFPKREYTFDLFGQGNKWHGKWFWLTKYVETKQQVYKKISISNSKYWTIIKIQTYENHVFEKLQS